MLEASNMAFPPFTPTDRQVSRVAESKSPSADRFPTMSNLPIRVAYAVAGLASACCEERKFLRHASRGGEEF